MRHHSYRTATPIILSIRMKTLQVLFYGFLSVTGFSILSFNVEEPRPSSANELEGHALIVAIGDYPEPSINKYSKINAGNDIPLVIHALRSQGFRRDRIEVLSDQDATRQGIIDAFNRLIDNSLRGNVVAFHYSGHGHQLTDDNGDELDGYDEVLVPFGATGSYEEGYDGGTHLRDDTINDMISRLRLKLGKEGHLFVSIDACFSGSATRDQNELPVRGVFEPLGPPSEIRGSGSEELVGPETGLSRGAGADEDIASFVVLSATRHDELDHEVRNTNGQIVGPLSLALQRVLPLVGKEMSYSSLFEQIRLLMSGLTSKQTPQIEGDTKTLVFNGASSNEKDYVQIKSTSGDSLAVIAAGTLLGVTPGSRVHFYSLESASADSPITQGIVESANELTSRVIVPFLPPRTELSMTRAFVAEYHYGDLDIGIQLESQDTILQKLRTALEALNNVSIVEEAPDLILNFEDQSLGAVLKTSKDGRELMGPFDPNNDDKIIEAKNRIRTYSRNRFLRDVSLSDPSLNLQVELIPATHIFDSSGSCVDSDTTKFGAKETSSGWTFRPGDGYLLRITNLGTQAAYAAVLSLGSDGEIGQLFPHPYSTISDNILESGRSHLIDLCYSASEPFGDEVLKLFATKDKIDFRPILSSPERSRGNGQLNYLEQMLTDGYSSTRSDVAGKVIAAASTHSVTIKVVE